MNEEIDNWKRRMKEEVITKNYLFNGWFTRSTSSSLRHYCKRWLEIENSSLSMHKNRRRNIFDSDYNTQCAMNIQLSSINEITISILKMNKIEVNIFCSSKNKPLILFSDFNGDFFNHFIF